MISYDYYNVFYYVCKYKNFTKAANVLLTSQSSISHTIHNLEHQLGCRLFLRNNRGIQLTPEGEQLYKYVALGCEQFMKGEAELLSSISLEKGTIYLGATETALHCFLFHALDEFHKKYPEVRFKINNYSTREAISALKNGTVDLALTATPFHIQYPLKSISLKSFKDILIGGKNYSFLKDTTLSLKDIEKYPFITFPLGTRSRDFLEEIFVKNNLIISPSVESATSDLILPMVKHNLGLGFIPEDMALDSLKKEEIILINIKETIPSRNICVIHDTTKPLSLPAKEFQKFLLELKKDS